MPEFISPTLQIILISGGLGVFIGYLIARLLAQQQIQQLSVDKARLETELEGDQEHYENQLALLHEARDSLTQHFAVLSQKALRQNNSLFLRLADQNLKLQQHRAHSEIDKRQQAIDNLISPIRDALKRTEQQIQQIEKERQKSFGALSEQLQSLNTSEIHLRAETQNLVHALKRPDVRGRWGEMTLKRLVELAGMVEYCDFDEQVKTDTANSLLRPDMIIRMPDHRELIIDAKAPLDGYLSAIDATSDEEKRAAIKRHARNLRERMKSLAGKSYWSQFKNSPDFVILFLPGDQFLSAALEQDAQLMEDSMKNHIVLATPSSLMALLRAVAFGWKQSVFSENAETIRHIGEDLYQRIATLTEHFEKLGKSLGSSVEYYNKTLGSLERQLLPGARKMTELGIQPKKKVVEIKPIEQSARVPQPKTEK